MPLAQIVEKIARGCCSLAVVLALIMPAGAQTSGNARQASGTAFTAEDAAEIKSLKEKLSDKASDEQRVDNCRVPLDRRGATPRPDCPPDRAAPSDMAGNGR